MAKDQRKLGLGHNSGSVDKGMLERLLKAIRAADDDLATMQGRYMASCKKPRKRIKETLAEAKAVGLDMPAFRLLIAEDRMARRKERRRMFLEVESAAALEAMTAALGDFASTGLGRAAIKQAQNDAALDSLSAG